MNESEQLAALETIATTWAVRHSTGLSAVSRAEFERWLAADPRHYAAFAEADLALSVLTPPLERQKRAELRAEMAAWELARRTRNLRRRRYAWSALGLAAAAAVLLVFRSSDSFPPLGSPSAATTTVRPSLQSLSDGSIIELNAGAQIVVEFTTTARNIRLLRGEAHFAVAKDPPRPFVVSVGPVKVQAVGTAFNVRFDPTEVEVLITEGHVRVTEETVAADLPPVTPVGAARETDLLAGHRTVIPLASRAREPLVVSAVTPEDIQRELTWRKMRFELSNATLEEAVALFNAKGHAHFSIGEPNLRGLRLSGIYWADNPQQFAELIESSLDLKAVPADDGGIVFRHR